MPQFKLTCFLDGDDDTTVATENVEAELEKLLDRLVAEGQIRMFRLDRIA
jgi:hypothetical protein